jgi:hypothetical protein
MAQKACQRADGGASADVVICVLYEAHSKASRLYADYPSMLKAATMRRSDTKKDAHTTMEVRYNE